MTEASGGQAIFDAGVIVLVDDTGAEPSFFLGRRQPSNVFLPDKWVFPGGRVEAGDCDVDANGALDAGDISALMWGVPQWGPREATGMALTAVRELFEETGLVIGHTGRLPSSIPKPWEAYAACHHVPALSPLKLIARAITPPQRPRRYDTRFFIAPRQSVALDSGTHDGEFTEKGWFGLTECRALDIPNITRLVLEDAVAYLESRARGNFTGIPFYYQEGGMFRRDVIPRMQDAAALDR